MWQLSGSCQEVIWKSSGRCKSVIRQLSGISQTVVMESSGWCKAVIRQSLISCLEVIKQPTDDCQAGSLLVIEWEAFETEIWKAFQSCFYCSKTKLKHFIFIFTDWNHCLGCWMWYQWSSWSVRKCFRRPMFHWLRNQMRNGSRGRLLWTPRLPEMG